MKHAEVVDAQANTCLLKATEYLSENSLLYRIKKNSLIVSLEENVDFDTSSFNIASGEGKYTMKRMYRSAEKFTMDFLPHKKGCEIQAVYESPRAREIFVAIVDYLKNSKSEKAVIPERKQTKISPKQIPKSLPKQEGIRGEKDIQEIALKVPSSGLMEKGIEALREHVDLELPLTFKEAFSLANSLLSQKYNADIKLDWEEFKANYQEAVNRWASEEEEQDILERRRVEKILPEGTIHCPQCSTLLRRTTIYDEELQSTRDGYRCMKCKKDFFKG